MYNSIMNENYIFLISILLKPFSAFAVLVFLAWIRYLVINYFPDNKIKSLLLHRVC